MDHFLSGLDNAAWYAARNVPPSAHEFSVGSNSYHLIPLSGSGVLNTTSLSPSAKNIPTSLIGSEPCNPVDSILALKGTPVPTNITAAASSHTYSIADSQIKVENEVKLENDTNGSREFSTIDYPKGLPKKEKNAALKSKWDMRKACNVCGKVLSRGDKLKNHMRIHTNNFPFHCNTCGQGFLRAEGLRIHTRIHTGERPYVCIICGKSYTRKDKLTRHAIVHTGERPFVCATCGKSFTRKDKLQRHELIHKVEKPWTCVPCNMEFGRPEAFNVHMERKHPERLAYTVIQQPRPNPSDISPSPETILAGTGIGAGFSGLLPPPSTSASALSDAHSHSRSPTPSTSSQIDNGYQVSITNKSLAHIAGRIPAAPLTAISRP